MERIAQVKCDISRIGHQQAQRLTWPDRAVSQSKN